MIYPRSRLERSRGMAVLAQTTGGNVRTVLADGLGAVMAASATIDDAIMTEVCRLPGGG